MVTILFYEIMALAAVAGALHAYARHHGDRVAKIAALALLALAVALAIGAVLTYCPAPDTLHWHTTAFA